MSVIPYMPVRPCVRCARTTHNPRLCDRCREEDEHMTRAAVNTLKSLSGAFSHELGYRDTVRPLEWPTVEEQEAYWKSRAL